MSHCPTLNRNPYVAVAPNHTAQTHKHLRRWTVSSMALASIPNRFWPFFSGQNHFCRFEFTVESIRPTLFLCRRRSSKYLNLLICLKQKNGFFFFAFFYRGKFPFSIKEKVKTTRKMTILKLIFIKDINKFFSRRIHFLTDGHIWRIDSIRNFLKIE